MSRAPGRVTWTAAGAILAGLILLVVVCAVEGAASKDEARVTRVVRDVKLLPEGAKAKPAAINDQVNNDTGVRTGDRSRSELTFTDLTIERLGANTLFHFDKAGRQVQLENGSMLLRVPKDSGGATMHTAAVTVGITGTTLILETTSAGRNKLIVLEGGARLSLNRYPRESVTVRGGQMEDVPPGATKLPPPQNIDLNDVMQHHPLITDFGPLPSQDQIYATVRNPAPPPPQVSIGPAGIAPVLGSLVGVPIGTVRGGRQPANPRGNQRGQVGIGTAPGKPNQDVGTVDGVRRSTPTPTPSRKRKGR